MVNYADYLAHFNFDVIFKSTKENVNVDYYSRTPLPLTVNAIRSSLSQEEEEIERGNFDFILNQIE